MSPLTRSKPASESSRVTGTTSDAPDPAADREPGAPAPSSTGADGGKHAGKPRERAARRGTLEIELEVSRQRSAGWTIFGLVVGALLIWKLGTVGVWAGVALVLAGIYHAWNLIQTFRYPPGTIVVSDREVSLPRGLCLPDPVVVKPQDVTAVYFLRRSVPWNHAAPVLIVELGPRAMAFPRDWFASESDQRHVVHALLRDKLSSDAGESDAEPA
jgi:hypothetical protein